METIIKSRVVVLGNNIDTDQIYPGRFLDIVEPEEIAKHCLAGIDEETRKRAPGSIVVAGTNFGCGSSREHAVITLLNAGVKAVVAESFARIFFRNAINLGFPLITCKGISARLRTGDEVTVNIIEGKITINPTGEIFPCPPISEHAMSILSAGGIKSLIKKEKKDNH
jgi:3-isopropylmalate/(R)-2-methylmalate dehydratase small subunit